MRSVLLVLLVACGGGKSPPPTTVSNPSPPPANGSAQPMVATPATRPACDTSTIQCAVDTFTFFTDQACACKDKACADRVNQEMSTWGNEMGKTMKDVKPDEATTKRMTEVATRYADCVTKLMTDGTTTTPPDPCGGGNPCGD